MPTAIQYKSHLKQVKTNLFVVAVAISLLQHGNGNCLCSGAAGVLWGKREPVLRVVPELCYTPPDTVILVKVTITVTIKHRGKQQNDTIRSITKR